MKPADAPPITDWLNTTQIAEVLGVSRQTVNAMINAGEFETLHLVGAAGARPQYWVRQEEVEQMRATRTFRGR